MDTKTLNYISYTSILMNFSYKIFNRWELHILVLGKEIDFTIKVNAKLCN